MGKGGFTPNAVEAVAPRPRARAAPLGPRLFALTLGAALPTVAVAFAASALSPLAALGLATATAIAASAFVARQMSRRIAAPIEHMVGNRLAASGEERRELIAQLERGYFETLRTLVNAIDAKDPYTRGHSQRTAEWAVLIARQLGLDEHEVREVEFGGLLHDIGKIGIAETILRKPARLDDDETRVMRGHPRIGDGIVADIDFLGPMRPMVRNHHERWDGQGYPDGLRGEEIPLGARIISAADAYDAITSDRCYQAGRSIGEAVTIITDLSGKQLDPVVVEALLSVLAASGLLVGAARTVTPAEGRPRRVTLDFAVRRDGES